MLNIYFFFRLNLTFKYNIMGKKKMLNSLHRSLASCHFMLQKYRLQPEWKQALAHYHQIFCSVALKILNKLCYSYTVYVSCIRWSLASQHLPQHDLHSEVVKYSISVSVFIFNAERTKCYDQCSLNPLALRQTALCMCFLCHLTGTN